MYRGTTPIVTINVKNKDIDLSSMKEIWVTFKSIKCEKTYSKLKNEIAIIEDDENKKIQIAMTQQDTLEFLNSKIKVQIRLLDYADRAYASTIVETEIKDILKDGEIYGEI